ncbi:MAG TPA: hypothetical protein VFJ82_17695 [Longimicrobium sp.]|nr:hypothetical protein [Longimicrobium sp.]
MAALGAVLAAGCDSPSAPKDVVPGVSVSYSGAVSGRFSVTAPSGGAAGQTYMEAYWADSTGFGTYSTRATADGRIDWITIASPLAPGEYVIDPRCQNSCPFVGVGLEQATGDWGLQEGESSWILRRGTITVRQPGADGRVRGTFAGSGELHRFTNGRWVDSGLGDVIVSGKFETGLVLPHPVP